jgi:hypothetical protein
MLFFRSSRNDKKKPFDRDFSPDRREHPPDFSSGDVEG